MLVEKRDESVWLLVDVLHGIIDGYFDDIEQARDRQDQWIAECNRPILLLRYSDDEDCPAIGPACHRDDQ